MACAITSIALDHEQYLGRTLAEIAAEKAGIIKPGVPVVVGPVASSAAERIAATAADAGAPLVWAMADCEVTEGTVQPDGSQSFVLRTPRRDYGSLHLGLAGTHQITNAVVAVRLLEQLEAIGRAVGETAIRQALGSVRWPGRLERIRLGDDREILLDAAHNPAGAAALARYLVSIGPPRPLVFAAMRDKDLTGMIAELAPVVSRVIATRASNPRSAEPADVAATIQSIAPALDVETAVSPAEALVRAWELGDKIVAAGSIFLLADVMKELGRS
jgi:dihydrofolate synthase/folylpolyglutamate synthase